MKTTIFLLMLGFGFSSQANTLFEQLYIFNPNWSNYKNHVPIENERVFLSDKHYIQAHLELVLQVLKSSDLKHLNEDQLLMRKHLTEVLSDYRLQGVFPINYYRAERIPVFIDEHNTHCAVGYLMRESGYGNLALQISKEDNYIWVKDLKDKQVGEWQQLSGFSLEELKLIQGAYDSYMPFAIEAPNRIEIPQKPEVVAMSFKPKDLVHSESKTGKYKFWIRGEGKDGVLHGRWEQNYSPALPWIVGFYQSGKRERKWLEYYQGTDRLCRTEHWKDDKLNGIRTRFNREGNVIEEILFQDGNAVVKTNYELNQSLKYVRKPIGDNIVWTEIYDMGGMLIASGHESVHNPGNLQWFQNIELTALNTMSLSSQTIMQSAKISRTGSDLGQGFGSVRLYSEPPLVEYIKQGDWVYYKDDTNIETINRPTIQDFQTYRFFKEGFRRLSGDILPERGLLEVPEHLPQFDSLYVNFTDGNVNWWNGYSQEERMRMEFEWFTSGNPPINIYNSYGHQRFNVLNQLKSYGFVNGLNEKINKWYHFDIHGQLSKVEEFIKPQPKDFMVMDAEEHRAQNQLPFTIGK